MVERKEASWSLAAVIPTYNRAAFLGRAIESVLTQQRPPDELIVVDDGSTDDTCDLVAEYGNEVTLIKKANGGVSSARNLGVVGSRSDYVAFLDSDDVWDQGHLASLETALIETSGSAGLYFSDLRLAPSRHGGTIWHWADFSVSDKYVIQGNGRSWAFLWPQPMTIQASLVRRDLYLAVGGCNEVLTCLEDTHLFFKLALSMPVCAVSGCAGELTGDSENSLTRTFSPVSETYLSCAAFLYDDLFVEWSADLTPDEKSILARRLADTHLSLARRYGAASPRRFLRHLTLALRNDPAYFSGRLARKLIPRTRDSTDCL